MGEGVGGGSQTADGEKWICSQISLVPDAMPGRCLGFRKPVVRKEPLSAGLGSRTSQERKGRNAGKGFGGHGCGRKAHEQRELGQGEVQVSVQRSQMSSSRQGEVGQGRGEAHPHAGGRTVCGFARGPEARCGPPPTTVFYHRWAFLTCTATYNSRTGPFRVGSPYSSDCLTPTRLLLWPFIHLPRPRDFRFAVWRKFVCTRLVPVSMLHGVSVPEKKPVFLFTQTRGDPLANSPQHCA